MQVLHCKMKVPPPFCSLFSLALFPGSLIDDQTYRKRRKHLSNRRVRVEFETVESNKAL